MSSYLLGSAKPDANLPIFQHQRVQKHEKKANTDFCWEKPRNSFLLYRMT